MNSDKSFDIPKAQVWNAWLAVKASKGGPGIDGVTLEVFEQDLKHRLYRIWNRLSSGSYFPSPVRRVDIPKADGGIRSLGIPNVEDRIAQAVVKAQLEPIVEPHFHDDSYGYRPGRSALDAVAKARQRCWRDDWVLDLDIRKFFDTLDHEVVLYTPTITLAGRRQLLWPVATKLGRFSTGPGRGRDGGHRATGQGIHVTATTR